MKKTILTLSVITLAMSLSACVSTNTSGSVYRAGQTQNEMSVRMGVIESVREVTIQNGSSGVGTMTGAALGGLAGSAAGGGRGSIATGIAGAVIGGIIGQNIEANSGMKKGVEITVRLDNGELKAIIQDAGENFRPGDRVRLLSDRRTTRVTH
jgi:outer membrane lipoprotein SlyB